MKYYGDVCFTETSETSPDVWTEEEYITQYYGDVIEGYGRSISNGTEINSKITVNNKISIVADPYILKHYFNIKYIVWEGIKWTVANVTVSHPRLILTLGGVYCEPEKASD